MQDTFRTVPGLMSFAAQLKLLPGAYMSAVTVHKLLIFHLFCAL